jgi:hypothetical protein
MVSLTNKERKRMQKMQYHASYRPKPSSSTSGKSKGLVPTPLQRYMCSASRSYKRTDYEEVMESCRRRKGSAK